MLSATARREWLPISRPTVGPRGCELLQGTLGDAAARSLSPAVALSGGRLLVRRVLVRSQLVSSVLHFLGGIEHAYSYSLVNLQVLDRRVLKLQFDYRQHNHFVGAGCPLGPSLGALLYKCSAWSMCP